MSSQGLSRFLEEKISVIRKVMDETKKRSELQGLVNFFLTLVEGVAVNAKTFSEAIIAVVENQFCGKDELAALELSILAHMDSVQDWAMDKYLKITNNTAVKEKLSELHFMGLVSFFREMRDGTVGMFEFSSQVAELAQHQYCGDEERLILRTSVLANLVALNPEHGLEPYLRATGDEEVGRACLDRFFAHEASSAKVAHDSPLAWDIKRAMSAVSVLVPEKKQEFATLVLEMFPDLPTGVNGNSGLKGFLLRCTNTKAPTGGLVSEDGDGQLRSVSRRPVTKSTPPQPVPVERSTIFASKEEVAKHSEFRETGMGMDEKALSVLRVLKEKIDSDSVTVN